MNNTEAVSSPELRRIQKEIASVVVISEDGKFLFGKKYSQNDGTYKQYWHLPGGGVEPGETLVEAAIREAREETGLELKEFQLKNINEKGGGESEKTLPDGERVICEMTFNRFEVRLGLNAEKVVIPDHTNEFEQMRWFAPDELESIEQIPGGREFFISQGYIQV